MSPVPAPRLCTLFKRPDFEGYGFNLYKKKSNPGQFIGSIDPGSPAEVAGLKEGDKLVEVNGQNVAQDNHKHAVQRIKEIPGQVTLLVVDSTCEQYHKEKKIKISGILPYILHLPYKDDHQEDKISDNLQSISIIGKIPTNNTEESDQEEEKFERSHSGYSSSSSGTSKKSVSASTETIRSTPSPASVDNDSLNLPETAREMRERIEKTKRRDPRKEERGDWWKKHMIVQAL